ncbi:MAG: O-antigen ligase family protein [Bacteroidetes bacterium]|nr:O-antigen ligase family protein [Bacteroidota bacterium]MBS1539429.1 O-antigen ligase family protein [Bacteroidota bacterium]
MRDAAQSQPVKQKIFIALACALMAAISLPPFYNSLATVVMFLYWLFFVAKKFNTKNRLLVVLISALFWISLVGLTYTQNMEEAKFRIFEQKILLLVYPLVFLTAGVDKDKVVRWLVSCFVVVIAAICLVSLGEAILYWLQHQSADHFFSHGLAQFLDIYPYVLSLLCLASVIMLMEAYLGNCVLLSFLSSRLLIVGLIIFFSAFIALFSVVQVILAWFILAVIYSFRLTASRRGLLIVLGAMALAVVLAVLLIPPLNKKVNETFFGKLNTIPLDRDASLGFVPWNGIAMRKAVWTCSMDVIKDNFWLGVGTGDGQDLLQQAYEKRQFYFASRYNRFNTHNQYLQTLVNFGAVGLALWLGSLALLFVYFKNNPMALSLLAICVWSMLTESMLETNKGIVAMALLLSFSALMTLRPSGKKYFF